MNTIQSNDATPADGKKLLAALKFKIPASLAAKFVAFQETHERISAAMAAFSPEAAFRIWRDAQAQAEADPTPGNLQIAAETTRDGVAAKFIAATEQLGGVRRAQMKQAAPIMAQIGTAVIEAVDEAIEKLAESRRSQLETFGVVYEQNEDALVKSIARFRSFVERTLVNPAIPVSPAHLENLLGPVGK